MKKMKRYITGCIILFLISVISFLPGCGNDEDVDSAETTKSVETMENVESGEDSIIHEKVDITQRNDEVETRQEKIDSAEVYELFLNGELTAGRMAYIKQEDEQEEKQVTISELFGDNDIEYCLLDIDGDGSDELHIRDNTAYYAIKAVDGTLQILFESWWNDYELIVTDELCGLLNYFNLGYGNEGIRFIKISADGSWEWEVFTWTDTNKNEYMDEEDDFYAETDSSDYEEIDMEKYVQYRKEHYVDLAGHELEWTNRRLKDFATWQEAYIDFLNKSRILWPDNDFEDEYALIYLDDNDIPELILDMGGNVAIVSFYDGNVRAMNPSRGYKIKYIEHDGRFYTRDRFCDVYRLEKGEFSKIGTGWVYEHYYFYTGFRYKYFWEGTEVTEEELEECLNKLIDTTQCIEPAELYTQDEMLERLAEWE
ncbi:MAG: hypothetical protein K2J60_11250 [Acetatifactor sp.]|nr:hypothetical protein [Acetatifactor sp.]